MTLALWIQISLPTQVIQIYRTHTCLRQVKTKEYSNRVQKEAAYKSLVDFCQAVNPDSDLVFVMKKIVNLRNAFRKEHDKVNNTMKSGTCTYEIYMCQKTLVLPFIGVYW